MRWPAPRRGGAANTRLTATSRSVTPSSSSSSSSSSSPSPAKSVGDGDEDEDDHEDEDGADLYAGYSRSSKTPVAAPGVGAMGAAGQRASYVLHESGSVKVGKGTSPETCRSPQAGAA